MKQKTALIALILSLLATTALASCDTTQDEKPEDTKADTTVAETTPVTDPAPPETDPITGETIPGTSETDPTPGTDENASVEGRTLSAIHYVSTLDNYTVDLTQILENTNTFYHISATELNGDNALIVNRATATASTGETSQMTCYAEGNWCYIEVGDSTFKMLMDGLESSSMLMTYNAYLWVEDFLTPDCSTDMLVDATETRDAEHGLCVITYTLADADANQAYGHLFAGSSDAPTIKNMHVTVTISEDTGIMQAYWLDFDMLTVNGSTIHMDAKMAFSAFGETTATIPDACKDYPDRAPNTNSGTNSNTPNANGPTVNAPSGGNDKDNDSENDQTQNPIDPGKTDDIGSSNTNGSVTNGTATGSKPGYDSGTVTAPEANKAPTVTEREEENIDPLEKI